MALVVWETRLTSVCVAALRRSCVMRYPYGLSTDGPPWTRWTRRGAFFASLLRRRALESRGKQMAGGLCDRKSGSVCRAFLNYVKMEPGELLIPALFVSREKTTWILVDVIWETASNRDSCEASLGEKNVYSLPPLRIIRDKMIANHAFRRGLLWTVLLLPTRSSR